MTIQKQITRSDERMHSDLGWLNSRHSFSFGGHYDPERMGFGPLRVVNDDIVAPGGGFPSHPHSDMEIISIVLDGQLEHKDSLGNGRIIEKGDIQYMSAGSGVVHSEFNPSSEHPVHFMQLWIKPNEKGLAPRYSDHAIVGREDNQWSLVFSPDGEGGSMEIRQDVELRTVQLQSGKSIEYRTERKNRGFWAFVIEGTVLLNGEKLSKGDSVALAGVSELEAANVSSDAATVMFFDVPL